MPLHPEFQTPDDLTDEEKVKAIMDEMGMSERDAIFFLVDCGQISESSEVFMQDHTKEIGEDIIDDLKDE